MLTPKQNILSRIVAAYVGVAGETPDPAAMVRLKTLAKEVEEFGADEVKAPLLLESSAIRVLGLGKRAESVLMLVAMKNSLASDRMGTRDLPVFTIFPYLFEDELRSFTNVGDTTIIDIKQKFAMCGCVIPARRPEEE